MVKNSEKASIREVYVLIEEMRKEVSGSINRLEVKFDILEAGRLSMLEKDFANFQGKMAIISAVVSFLIGLLFLVINYYLK